MTHEPIDFSSADARSMKKADIHVSTRKAVAKAKAIIAMIDANTDYDADTIKFHRDGSISAIKDANKTLNGPETDRLLVGYVADFANDANPFRA